MRKGIENLNSSLEKTVEIKKKLLWFYSDINSAIWTCDGFSDIVYRNFKRAAGGGLVEDKTIWYLCDGEKKDCKKTRCYKNTKENPCRHTKDISHAVNFRKIHGNREVYRESDCDEIAQPEQMRGE